MSREPADGDLPSVLTLARKTARTYKDEQSIGIAEYRTPLTLEEVQQEPGTEIRVESGGFTPEKRHLKAMESHMAVCVYEPLQNLSYGLGFHPPPVVIFGLTDGSRVIYDGVPAHAPPYERIAYQSFVTGSPEGITPSTAVLPIHRDQKDADEDRAALGFFGEGLKNAVTYLLTKFPDSRIEINSMYTHGKTRKKHAWVGKYGMRDTTDGHTQQLAVEFTDVDPNRVTQTSTTVYGPPREFYETTIKASETFLFMNAHYRGGVFVPGNHDFNEGIRHQALVKGLGMEVLDTGLLFGTTQNDPVGHGFMDGQRFVLERDAGYSRDMKGKFFFVWHFVGGLDAGTAYEAQIQRGRDSAQIEGLDKLPSLLRTATNSGHLEADFWVALFEKMYAHDYVVDINGSDYVAERFVPYELKDRDTYKRDSFDGRGAKTIREAWKTFSESHPEIQGITDSESEVNSLRRLRKTNGTTQARKVMMMHGMYDELKSICGDSVKDAQDLTRSDVNEAIEHAPPLEIIENARLVKVDTNQLVPVSTVFEQFGRDFEHVKLSLDPEHQSIVLMFDFSMIAPLYVPKQVQSSLFYDPAVFTRLASLTPIKDPGKPIGIRRVESTGIEINLNVDVAAEPSTALLASGTVRKMNRFPSVSTVEVSIPIPAGNYQKVSEAAKAAFNAARDAILKERDVENMKKEELEMRLAAEQEKNQRLEQQLNSLMTTIRKDDALNKDSAVQAALLQAEQAQQKLDDMIREKRIQFKEAIELKVAQLAELRKHVWKIGSRVIVGGGALFLSKEVLLPWAMNNDAIKHGLAVVGDTVAPITSGLKIPTILDVGEYVPVPQVGENGIGLGWTIYDDVIVINADNEPQVVNVRAFWPKQEQESSAPARELKIHPKVIPLVSLEGMDPTVDTSGYYFTSFTNTLTVVPDAVGGHVRGSYTGKSEYSQRQIPFGRPKEYLLRQIYTPNMPEHTWTPIATRPGEMPVRFAGADSALFRQNQMTGGWEIKMSKHRDKNLIVYTAAADESALTYLKRKPVAAETEPLLDMETLRPDIREAILAVQQSSLTAEEKIEEGLAIWRQVYRYDRVADKYSFPQTDAKQYVSAMINQGIGPCGYAALGAVAILREIGIPADAVGGFLNELYGQELDVDELHAWIYVWNETAQSWKYIEPQNGLQTQRYKDEKNGWAYDTQQTAAPEPDERRSPNLPVSIDYHVSGNPEPAFAGLVRTANELLNTQWDPAGLPGLNISLEKQIVTYIASEEAKRRRRELAIAVAPLVATAIAPSAVDFFRKVILIKKKIRNEVDAELLKEKQAAAN